MKSSSNCVTVGNAVSLHHAVPVEVRSSASSVASSSTSGSKILIKGSDPEGKNHKIKSSTTSYFLSEDVILDDEGNQKLFVTF